MLSGDLLDSKRPINDTEGPTITYHLLDCAMTGIRSRKEENIITTLKAASSPLDLISIDTYHNMSQISTDHVIGQFVDEPPKVCF